MNSEKSTNKDTSSHNKKTQNRFFQCLYDNLFMIFVLIGVGFGFGIGFAAKYIPDREIAEIWIQLPGELYINLLQLAILPLIASNLIIVISKIEPREQGRTGFLCLSTILFFNIFSASVGTAIAALINPGSLMSSKNETTAGTPTGLELSTSDVFANLFLNLCPNSIIGMTIFQTNTKYELDNSTGIEKKIRMKTMDYSTNMTGVLFISILFGIAAQYAGEEGKKFVDIFKCISEVVLIIIRWFLMLTPFGVCFMIAGAILKVENIAETFTSLGFFILVVMIGSLINLFITLIIYFVVIRRNPFKLLKHCINACFVAFATTSPIVSIPEIYNGCDDYGIKSDVSLFVCPLQVTLKADGPAIFISSSAMFVAQMSMGTVPVGKTVLIWFLTSVSVLAIPHIPSASIVIVITILSSIGVPTQNVSIIYAIDWLLDRVRSVVSTISTMFSIAFIDLVGQRKKIKSADDIIDKTSEIETSV